MARNRSVLLVLLLTGLLGCRPAGSGDSGPAAPDSQPAEPAAAASAGAKLSQDPAADGPSSVTKRAPAAEPVKPAVQESSSAPAAISELAVRLIEPDPAGGWRISQSAALELEKRGPDASESLWDLLENMSADTRRGAAFYLLGQFNPNRPEQVDAFLRLLRDEDALVRNIALQAVKQLREPDLIASQSLLAEVLDPAREPDPDQRAAAARLLQRLKSNGSESAAVLSRSAADDPDPKVRGAALVALSQIAEARSVVPAAQQALADPDAGVRLVAAARLRQLGRNSLPAAETLAGALSDPDERVRSAAAEALVKLGPDAVAALTGQVAAESALARQLAIACLSRIGPPARGALPELERRLQDDDDTVRKLAAIAIGKIKEGEPPPVDEK